MRKGFVCLALPGVQRAGAVRHWPAELSLRGQKHA
jgi:hypothetical protein